MPYDLVRLVGPVSAVLHIPPPSPTASSINDLTRTLQALSDLYTSTSHPEISQRLDIHLVSSHFPRQLNAWRNLARAYARTGWVMMLDVDLSSRTDVRGAFDEILNGGGEIGEEMKRGMGALVVPAFEYKESEREPEDFNEFPATKQVSRVACTH
jgi:hypothetical protein